MRAHAACASSITPNNNELASTLNPVCADHRSGLDGAKAHASEAAAAIPPDKEKERRVEDKARRVDGHALIMGAVSHAVDTAAILLNQCNFVSHNHRSDCVELGKDMTAKW